MFVIAPGDKRQEVAASVRCHDLSGRVGEWLKPADCKSAAPCGLRRFESSPVHQRLLRPQRSSDLAESWVPVFGARRPRSRFRSKTWEASGKPVRAWVAQLVERVLGKDEVTGSIPVPGSMSGAAGMSGGNSVVESLPSKQMVAGSSPVPRSILRSEWNQ